MHLITVLDDEHPLVHTSPRGQTGGRAGSHWPTQLIQYHHYCN